MSHVQTHHVDSFFDQGRHDDPGVAVEHGLRLAEQGADVLDIGGESTRPRAEPVPAGQSAQSLRFSTTWNSAASTWRSYLLPASFISSSSARCTSMASR